MSDQSERQTRREMIDPALKKAGWPIKPFDDKMPLSAFDCCAVTEYPTDNGPADYALCVDGRILGIVEAELARREGRSYEPASVLLEQIRAEREKGKPEPRTRR